MRSFVPGFEEVFFDPIEPGDGLQRGGGEGLAGLEGFVIFPANMRPAGGELESRVLVGMGRVSGVAIGLEDASIIA